MTTALAQVESPRLPRYDAMRNAIHAAHSVDEAKDIKDKAQALLAYARQRKDPEVARLMAEIKLRARRRIGEISETLEKAAGRPGKILPSRGKNFKASTLKSAGLSTSEAHRCEQIAACPSDEFEEYIEDKTKKGQEVNADDVIRKVGRKRRKEKQAEDIEKYEAPKGKFPVIVVDPPWQYEKRKDDVTHRGACPYPTMTTDEICAMRIPSTDDCVLWLWTTNAFMRDAFRVLDAWGFHEKTILTWVKDRMGVGDWLRGKTEHCILAVKGKPVVTLTNQTTVLEGKVREHSRKPTEFYDMVAALCPMSPRLELFSREKRAGFVCAGSEVGKFTET